MLDAIFTIVLALHLLCVNVASAGPIVCLWLERKESRGDALAGGAATFLGKASFHGLLAGLLLGIVLGLLNWSPEYARLWTTTLSKKTMWGIAELLFSALLLGFYVLGRRRPGVGRRRRCAAALLAGTNLLYHFPILFTIATTIHALGVRTEGLDPATGKVLRSEFYRYMLHPNVLSRTFHIVLACFAVTGTMLLGYALRLRKQGDVPESDVNRVIQWGAQCCLFPSLLQVPIGLAILATSHPEWQSRVMGGDLFATAALGVSVVVAMLMLQDLASIAFGETQRKLLIRVMTYMLIVVVLMTGVLRRMHGHRTATPFELKTQATSVQGTSRAD